MGEKVNEFITIVRAISGLTIILLHWLKLYPRGRVF